MRGYAKVAQLMASHNELAIFRRFQELNMRNLLYLQAELSHLEAELRDIVEADTKYPECANNSYDWWSLTQAEDCGGAEQWDKILEIREKLDKYSTQFFFDSLH